MVLEAFCRSPFMPHDVVHLTFPLGVPNSVAPPTLQAYARLGQSYNQSVIDGAKEYRYEEKRYSDF